MLLAIDMCLVDLLLDSLDSLIGKRLVFKHCDTVSQPSLITRIKLDLQNVSSSSVRPYVSGYMKYTNKNSKLIHPQ